MDKYDKWQIEAIATRMNTILDAAHKYDLHQFKRGRKDEVQGYKWDAYELFKLGLTRPQISTIFNELGNLGASGRKFLDDVIDTAEQEAGGLSIGNNLGRPIQLPLFFDREPFYSAIVEAIYRH